MQVNSNSLDLSKGAICHSVTERQSSPCRDVFPLGHLTLPSIDTLLIGLAWLDRSANNPSGVGCVCDSNTTCRGLTWRAGVHHGFRCVYVCLDGVIYFKLSVKIATVTQHVSSNQPKATVWTLLITFTMYCLHTSSPNIYILIMLNCSVHSRSKVCDQ